MIDPKILVLMTSFNRAHLIGETLESIRAQNYERWECIIVDDFSIDNTEEVVKSYASKDSRFSYYLKKKDYKPGLSGGRNYLLDLAFNRNADYLIFIDDDDFIHPENFLTCVTLLQKTGTSFCRFEKKPFNKVIEKMDVVSFTEKDISFFGVDRISEMITGSTAFASCTVMWEKECFEGFRFNEDLNYAEEWECYSRILATGFLGISVDQVLYYNRKHSKSNTGEYREKKGRRVESHINASLMVIQNLSTKKIFNEQLKQFFIRLGITLNSFSIINQSLIAAESSWLEKWKYKVGYKLYPVLKPIFYFKSKIFFH